MDLLQAAIDATNALALIRDANVPPGDFRYKTKAEMAALAGEIIADLEASIKYRQEDHP